ncbi:MAG: T9SS type A sorting domain-containing protein, partial [Alphaproteobacteria bacterium]|nr:T9SS type A sorting domain-containing protein [Alphaproteobacteria bacterium]
VGLMGNVLQKTSPSSPDFELDLSGLPSGMYLVKVQFADGRIAFRKVVKR